MFRIGIDLGGTKIAAGAVDSFHRIRARVETPTRTDSPETIADDIARIAIEALEAAGGDIDSCGGIGIGSPGLCDSAAGTVRNAHNLGLYGVPLCAMVAERTGLPVRIDNDANCAALGEVTAGAAQGSENALMVTLGTGVGGGIIIGGRIFSGWKSLGGEIGHICICMDGEQCSCGERGCWEAYASASALVRQAERAAEKYPRSALAKCGALDGRKIFAALREGDSAAKEVFENYCRYVGVGLTAFVNSIYPESIIIGGGISAVGETLIAPIREYVAEHFFASDRALMPYIVPAKLGNDAGIIGAAALLIN